MATPGVNLPSARGASRNTALIVDDNDAAREELQESLEWLLRFEVTAVGCLSRAIQHLGQHGLPRLMIVDLHLGADDGAELVRYARALPGFAERAPLIVATSGYPDAATRLATLQAPWVPLLKKPLAIDALAQLLTRHLGGRRPEGA